HPVGELDRRAARHVLDDDGRLSGNVIRVVAGERPGIGIVAAAGGVADIDGELLALIEIGDFVSRRAGDRRGEQKRQSGRADEPVSSKRHDNLLIVPRSTSDSRRMVAEDGESPKGKRWRPRRFSADYARLPPSDRDAAAAPEIL